MSLKRLLRLRNTLAFRLTLWYAGIFTVSSCVAFLLFYTLITSVIRERTDQELLGQAREFSTVLAARGLDAVKNLAMIEAQAAGVQKGIFPPSLPQRAGLLLFQHVVLDRISASGKRP